MNENIKDLEIATKTPCDWCNDIKGFIGDGAESIDVSGFLFCPNCGYSLENEA